LRLTPEKAEIIGALLGDKVRFGFFKRYGNWTKSKKPRGILEICLGSNAQWGEHLSDLAFRAYGLRGSTYPLKKPYPRQPEWRFSISSPRVVKDLLPYFDPAWRAATWRIVPAILESPKTSIRALLRGYMDADGFVHKSSTRGVRVESVNENGINDVLVLFGKLGIEGRIYRRKSKKVWALQISRKRNISRYRKLVGFSQPHKSKALDNVWKQYPK
jgi:intein/homing endonuclease